jgi:hypothetical protein
MLDNKQYARTTNDIREKWNKAEQLVIDCNPKSVYVLSEIDVLLEKYKFEKYKEHGREWSVLLEDQEILKKEFATTCICKKKEKK